MKIAVTYDNGQIFQHFGHSAQFKLYEVSGGMILNTAVVDTNGSGHGALGRNLLKNARQTFMEFGEDLDDAVVLAEQFGIEHVVVDLSDTKAALTQAGIRLYGGVSGDADAAVLALLAGKLGYDPDVRCTHHDEAHGEGSHTCGSHGCGNHSCH